jgi:hypothetical protein
VASAFRRLRATSSSSRRWSNVGGTSTSR